MTVTLAFELMTLILEELHDSKPTLGACSLVCRAWAQLTRNFLFRTLSLTDHNDIALFLGLLESPFETISGSQIKRLEVSRGLIGSTEAFNDLLKESSNGNSLSNIFGRIETLYLGWWRPDDVALQCLISARLFSSVKSLTIFGAEFVEHQKLEFLHAFPALEVLLLQQTARIKIYGSKPRTPLRALGIRALPTKLHTVILVNQMHDAGVVEALIPCTTLRDLRVHIYNTYYSSERFVTAIRSLCSSAGTSLEHFLFSVEEWQQSGEGLVNLFGFEHNPDLKTLRLDLGSSALSLNLLPIMGRLASLPRSNLGSIMIPNLHETDLDWQRLEEIVLGGSFTSLENLQSGKMGPLDDRLDAEALLPPRPEVDEYGPEQLRNKLPQLSALGILQT